MAEAAPFEIAAQLKNARYRLLGADIAVARDRADILVLDFGAALVELAHQHQDRLQNIDRLEAGDGDRFAVFLGEKLIRLTADHDRDMRRPEEAVDLDGAELAHRRRLEDGRDRRGGEHVIAEHREIRQALLGGGLDRQRGRRRRGLETDGEEDDLALRVGFGELHRVERGIDHADVGAVGPGFHQALPLGAGHAQHVGVGSEDDAVALGEADRHVEPAGGQHADRTAGAMHHLDIGGQQILDAIAEDGMGVAAAELHQPIAPAAICRLVMDRCGEAMSGLGVAVFVEMLHGGASIASPAAENSARASPPSAASNAKVRSASASSILASA